MTRKVIGILAGLAFALVLAWLIRGVSDYAFAPAGLDPSDPVQAGQIMAEMPLPGLVFALVACFAASYAGGFIAAKIARERWAAWPAMALMAVITLTRQLMAHYPLWLVIASVAIIAVAAWLAGQSAGDAEPEPDEADAEPAPAPWSAPQQTAAFEAAPDPEPDLGPEADPQPEPTITRPRYASFDELRAAAPRPRADDDRTD